jgi:putative SOS response-associated peptidase YedK
MCFHFSITKEKQAIEQALHATWDEDGWKPFYHVDGFLFPEIPILTQQNRTQIQEAHWGLIPHWIKGEEEAKLIRAQTLNARTETVFEKPSFKKSILENRCLIPATGFFEWMDFGGKKYPHFIFLKHEPLFFFGGIASEWVDPKTGELVTTCSILTTEANEMMAKIHNLKKRMPLIISKSNIEMWLDAKRSKADVEHLFRAYPTEEMDAYTIGKRITSKTMERDVPEILESVIYPELWAC